MKSTSERSASVLANRHHAPLTREAALALAEERNTAALQTLAAQLRDEVHPIALSYSRKVFIPLTQLCRDVCHYCTFAHPPRSGQRAYMTRDEVLAVARAGAAQGCKEALFTLGDKPELRYQVARQELDSLGHETTCSYLEEMAQVVFEETGLLPHVNPGVLNADEITRLRRVSVSQGLMLESVSPRLCERGGPHFGSPDKYPAARLETIRLAGELRVPFTSGILIGIGETRRERIESLLALRDLHTRYGHLQEVIIQNFRAKPLTKMALSREPCLDELLWTIAVARLVFGPDMNLQAPPNLSPRALPQLIAAGINDWGGVSPVTPDHVNPEAPWPHLDALARTTGAAGKYLTERLALYPAYARDYKHWVDPQFVTPVLRAIDADGFVRAKTWAPGKPEAPPAQPTQVGRVSTRLTEILERASAGEALSEADIIRLFQARGREYAAVCTAADAVRTAVNGDTVSYVVNRNINYTNVCYFRCQFCAFSKGKLSENLRGRPYSLSLEEIERRGHEAWRRGATELCLQGGIHPEYTGATYLEICRRLKAALPDMHLHAFTPLELWQGAETLGTTVAAYLAELRDAGLGTLPGTAAEVLDDEIREVICPDKVNTHQWLSVMRTAHALGLRSTATIMFGHVDGPANWARHLLRVRELQIQTGGFTEFVPLPFVSSEAPIYLKGRSRTGPSFREAVLMHAVARLALHPHIRNVQTSWVKMGPEGVRACLNAGANDLGGTLMNESITRAAGAEHGEELEPRAMEALIRSIGRTPRQRTTLYADAPSERTSASFAAAKLVPTTQASPRGKGQRNGPLIRPGLLSRREP